MKADPKAWDIPGMISIEPRQGYRITVRVERKGHSYNIPIWVDVQEVRPVGATILDAKLGFAAWTNFEENWEPKDAVRAVGRTEQEAVQRSVALFREDEKRIDRWLGLDKYPRLGDSNEPFYAPLRAPSEPRKER